MKILIDCFNYFDSFLISYNDVSNALLGLEAPI